MRKLRVRVQSSRDLSHTTLPVWHLGMYEETCSAGQRDAPGDSRGGESSEGNTLREKRMLQMHGMGGSCEASANKRQRKALKAQRVYEEYKLCVPYPEVLEIEDVASPDVGLLNVLRGAPHSVPVPGHWKEKRGYLSTSGGMHKKPYTVPDKVLQTGVYEARKARHAYKDSLSLKQRQKLKLNPKAYPEEKAHRGVDVDVPCPVLSRFGELYHENTYSEGVFREVTPGKLSAELAAALGMQDAKRPPPWLYAMQKYGLPPAYPNMKVPGVNAPIPKGCRFGCGDGCWGTPPVGSDGRPVYPDVYMTPDSDEGGQDSLGFFHPADFSTVLCRNTTVESKPDREKGSKKVFKKEAGTFV